MSSKNQPTASLVQSCKTFCSTLPAASFDIFSIAKYRAASFVRPIDSFAGFGCEALDRFQNSTDASPLARLRVRLHLSFLRSFFFRLARQNFFSLSDFFCKKAEAQLNLLFLMTFFEIVACANFLLPRTLSSLFQLHVFWLHADLWGQ